MPLPILNVALRQVLCPDHEKVLSVVLLCYLREFELAGDNHCLVVDHVLAYCNLFMAGGGTEPASENHRYSIVLFFTW
jgi:hypothetical protein